ncbi:MAG: cryptochrome/photolyase family protein, partial [Cytophagaceae bacterium]
FLEERLELFGPYEDAIAQQYPQMFHSVISPLLNNGLLTPQHVVETTLHFAEIHNTPIESLEGFIRQIIGWREYMRATYVRYGREMRTRNHLNHSRSLDGSWWTGNTGLEPVDTTIHSVLSTGYAHHIERLMILGNAMLLLRIHPDEVYEWFMSLFIDAYDWVMVPNAYAMSQFAAGDKITTKPYISGSNYIFKMSDYKKGDWAGQWDALYWRFIADNRTLFENNYRSAIMVKLYDRQSDEKKTHVNTLSDKWLT